MDLSLPSKSMAEKLRPKFKQIEVWDYPHTSLAASSFAGTYGYWQQMKTTEDLEGLIFS